MAENRTIPNERQIEYWNSQVGEHWASEADRLDRMMSGVGQHMLNRAALREGWRVLDIGSGAGAVTLAAQDRVGDAGRVTGLDISKPLLELARARAAAQNSPADFVECDAATWQDKTEADAIVSRLGVMFFDDPVAAFANIRRLSKRGGRLTFVCWTSPEDSDLASGLLRTVAHLVKEPPQPTDPTAPGPFAFADKERVGRILTEAGWGDVSFERWEGRLTLPGETALESARFIAQVGPLSRLIRAQELPFEQVVDAITPFLEERRREDSVALNASAWLASAQA